MTFDPFGDFESRGYLRNFASLKDISQVKNLEYASFQGNLSRAINALAAIDFIEYKHVLAIHETLFGDVYPWAGRDRLLTAPNINISKGGYGAMFAQPPYIRRVTDYALDLGRDPNVMRERPGHIMGSLAHAHPFLDGNGRTIMVLHTELAYRAGISIDWGQTDKTDYLTALTKELNDPDLGYLDLYLKPFIQDAVERKQSISALKSLKGLGETQKQHGHFHDCLNVLVQEHGGKWILFEDGRIIHSASTKEELELKIQSAKDLDCYRPADFVVFVPRRIEDLQEQAIAEPKSKAAIAVAEIFRAATDREKLEIFKEICDLRIQSIGIEFPEE